MNDTILRMPYNAISKSEFELFRAFLSKISGIDIPPEKAYLFETRLAKMMAEAGKESFAEFYEYVQSGEDPMATQNIINAMTTNETLWFRDAAPWRVMEDTLLPALVNALVSGQKSRIRIWCAAVSTGQEAYSTAMCIDDYLEKNGVKGVTLSDFDIVATDISTRVLDIAKKGRYDAISIRRGLSDYYRTKYFTKIGAAWHIDPKIHEAVDFSAFNLNDGFYRFGTFDIIFCRYILIYFSQERKKDIITKMSASLAAGGSLFAENYTMYDLFEDCFEVNRFSDFSYYTKKAVLL